MTNGDLVSQIAAARGAYGACVASLDAIAEWKRMAENPPLPPERPVQTSDGSNESERR